MLWLVGLIGVAGMFMCGWRFLQAERAEMQGLFALACLCFSRQASLDQKPAGFRRAQRLALAFFCLFGVIADTAIMLAVLT